MSESLHDSSNNNLIVHQGWQHKIGRSYVSTLTCDIYGIQTTSNTKGNLSYFPDEMGGIVDPPYLTSIISM